MSRTIDTLVPDIEAMLAGVTAGGTVEISPEVAAQFGVEVVAGLVKQFSGRTRLPRTGKNTLRMSEIGKPCHRQVWYDYHTPELAEHMQPHTIVKFIFGDIIESLALLLAKLAGHSVTEEQGEVEWEYMGWKIRGRKDAIIDGVLVDVKSASGRGMGKFEEGLNDDNDSFGYRAQLSGYMVGESLGTGASEQGFLVKNKETGRLVWSPVAYESPLDKVEQLIVDLENDAFPPARAFADVKEGESGNRKLAMECSYCPFKLTCWPAARGFAYAKGPVWLTVVKKLPNVPEFTKTQQEKAQEELEAA